ncbi:hypothetical protein BJX65DRAFT_306259 [Aspergillus insuetus]
MKPLTYIPLLLGIYATTALAGLRPDATPEEIAAAEAECGSLGVMWVAPEDLPEGITYDDVRLCADHPLGPNAGPGAGPGIGSRLREILPSWEWSGGFEHGGV